MKIQEFRFGRDRWLSSHQPFQLKNLCSYLAYIVLFMVLKCLCQRTLLKRSNPLQFHTWFYDHLEDHECPSLCHLSNKHHGLFWRGIMNVDIKLPCLSRLERNSRAFQQRWIVRKVSEGKPSVNFLPSTELQHTNCNLQIESNVR